MGSSTTLGSSSKSNANSNSPKPVRRLSLGLVFSSKSAHSIRGERSHTHARMDSIANLDSSAPVTVLRASTSARLDPADRVSSSNSGSTWLGFGLEQEPKHAFDRTYAVTPDKHSIAPVEAMMSAPAPRSRVSVETTAPCFAGTSSSRPGDAYMNVSCVVAFEIFILQFSFLILSIRVRWTTPHDHCCLRLLLTFFIT